MEKGEEIISLSDVDDDAPSDSSNKDVNIESAVTSRPKTREEEIEDNLQLQIQQAIEDSIINNSKRNINMDNDEIDEDTFTESPENKEIENIDIDNASNTNAESVIGNTSENESELFNCDNKIEDPIENNESNLNTGECSSNQVVNNKEQVTNEEVVQKTPICGSSEKLEDCTENASAKTIETTISNNHGSQVENDCGSGNGDIEMIEAELIDTLSNNDKEDKLENENIETTKVPDSPEILTSSSDKEQVNYEIEDQSNKAKDIEEPIETSVSSNCNERVEDKTDEDIEMLEIQESTEPSISSENSEKKNTNELLETPFNNYEESLEDKTDEDIEIIEAQKLETSVSIADDKQLNKKAESQNSEAEDLQELLQTPLSKEHLEDKTDEDIDLSEVQKPTEVSISTNDNENENNEKEPPEIPLSNNCEEHLETKTDENIESMEVQESTEVCHSTGDKEQFNHEIENNKVEDIQKPMETSASDDTEKQGTETTEIQNSTTVIISEDDDSDSENNKVQESTCLENKNVETQETIDTSTSNVDKVQAENEATGTKDINTTSNDNKERPENENVEKLQLTSSTSNIDKEQSNNKSAKTIRAQKSQVVSLSNSNAKQLKNSRSDMQKDINKPVQKQNTMKVANSEMLPQVHQQEFSIREVDRSNNLYEVIAINEADNSIEIIDDDEDDEQDEAGQEIDQDDIEFVHMDHAGQSQATFQDIVDRVVSDSSHEFTSLPLECIITEKPDRPVMHNIINHNVPSEWLKAYLEETHDPDYMISKQEIYSDYCYFCEQNGIQPFALTMFGKLMKQLFPNLMQRRIRSKGQSMYCYVGLRKCYDYPHFANYANKTQPVHSETRNEVDMSVNDDNYRSGQLDGKTILVHDPLALLSLSTKEEVGRRAPTKAFTHRLSERTPNLTDPRLINRNNANRINISRNDINRTITNQNVANKNNINKSVFNKIINRPIKSVSVKSTTPRLKSVSVKSTTQRPNIFKVKYQQYRHPSIKNVLSNYNSIILPSEILSSNINPRITLNDKEVYNWYAKQLKNRMKKLLYTSITQNEDGKNYKITCRCCTNTSQVNANCANQIQSLKENLLDFVIKKSSDNLNYQVVHLQRSHVLKPKQQLDNSTCHIVKKLKVSLQTNDHKQILTPKKAHVNQSQSNEHASIQKIRNKFKNINIPKEMCKVNVDPLVLLNSGEVLEWFTHKMDYLKNKLSDVESIFNDIILTEKNAHSPRQSKAKTMNFCEIDSSDYEGEKDDRRSLRRRGSAALVNKPPNTEVVTESIHKSNFDKLTNLFNSRSTPVVPNNTFNSDYSQQAVLVGQKRPLTNESGVNEIEQKKKRYICSKITVNSNQNVQPADDLMETTSSTSVEQVKNYTCRVCGDEFSKPKLGDHIKKHLQCKRCKKKLKNLEGLIQHFTRHCIVNYTHNLPHLKLQKIDTVEAVIKKYPSAFEVNAANSNSETVTNRETTNITSKPSSKFCVRNLYVNKRSHSATNAQGNCIRTYSKKAPISSPAEQVVGITSGSGNPPILQLKNTINSNLNKILVLSNNVSLPSNVVYGRVFVNSVGQSSAVHITSTSSATSNLQQPSQIKQVENSNSQNSILDELQDHSYHQQQTVISIENNEYIVMSDSTPNENATSARKSIITTNELTNNQDVQDSLKISDNETTNKEETDSNNSSSAKGQFKIRVKSLQELS